MNIPQLRQRLTDQEKEVIFTALGIYRNVVETGDKDLALEDAARQNLKVRPMTEGQMRKALEIRDLMNNIY
jgi:hypothetical protein